MTRPIAAGVAVLLFAASAHAQTRVAVIAIGQDATATGAMQRAVELRLQSSPAITVRPASEVAPFVAIKSMPAATFDAGAQKRASDLMEAASKAYYEDKLVDALDRLAQVAAVYERSARVPTQERVRLLLWRTAVLLALNDREKAEVEARAALVLAPDLKVDSNVFRPSVVKLVDDIRARGLPTGTVLLSGFPAGSETRVDDRVVQGERVTVPLGRHRVAMRTPGFLEVERTVDVTGDTTVAFAAPLALDSATERTLSGAVTRGEAGDARAILERVADRGDADLVLLVQIRSDLVESRTFLWTAKTGAAISGGPFASDAPAPVAEWAAAKISSPAPAATPRVAVVRATPAPTPRAVRTPRPSTRGGFPISGEAGFAFVQHGRDVSGGGGFSSGFIGAGPRVRVDGGAIGPTAQVDVGVVTYAFSKLDVNLPDGTRKTVDGGSTIDARLSGGWRLAIGGNGMDGATVALLAGAFFDLHQGNDLKDGSGALGIFPSSQRLGADVRVAVRAPAGPVHLGAELGAEPFSTWSEDPSGTTGSSPKPGVVPLWRLSGSWSPDGRLAIGAQYAGEIRSVTFSGPASAPLNPPIQNAKVTETVHALTLSVRRSF